MDFYCPKLVLAIEIDGSSHDGRLEKDVKRQKDIEKQGVRFLRFWDQDVQKNMKGVLQVITE